MKKIFTIILFAAGTISFASAQSRNGKDIAWNDNNKTNNNYGQHPNFGKDYSVAYNSNNFSYKEKQAKLEKINREFDQKINAVKYNRRLSSREKAKQIQSLQNQQKNEINKVEYSYAKSNQQANNAHGHNSHK